MTLARVLWWPLWWPWLTSLPGTWLACGAAPVRPATIGVLEIRTPNELHVLRSALSEYGRKQGGNVTAADSYSLAAYNLLARLPA